MQQLGIREELFNEQCQTGSEEFVIIDEQYAHRIVSRQHMPFIRMKRAAFE